MKNKFKFSKLEWEKSIFDGSLNGEIRGRIFFEINKKGIRKPKFVLQSFPLPSGIFPKATTTKNLGEYKSVKDAQSAACEFMWKFVLSFMTEL